MLLTLLFASVNARASEILVVLSGDSVPYTQAGNRCQKLLESRGHKAKQVQIDSVDEASIRTRTTPVVAIGSKAAAELAKLLPTQTQLYYCMTPSPDRIGLLRRENTSGISTDSDISAQIALMQGSGMTIKRVGMLYRSNSASSVALRDQFERGLPAGWTLIADDLDEDASISKSIDRIFEANIDIVWTAADTAVFNSSLIKSLLLRSLRERVPVFGFSHALVRAGATFGVGFEPEDQGERVASMLNDGLIGVHEPARSDLAVNRTVISRMNLAMDSGFVRGADVKYGEE
jgi:putative ABC transport system substrate-binding protein